MRFSGGNSSCVRYISKLCTRPDFREAAPDMHADLHHVGLSVTFCPNDFNKPDFKYFKDLRKPDNGVVWVDKEPVCGAISVRW